MTYRALYLEAKRELTAAGVDAPGPDALALLSHFFGLDRPGLALRGEESPAPEGERAFLAAAGKRAERVPLQYILGEWEFMGLSLKVGEGALCPREDTAVLVEALARRLRGNPVPVGLDLCAGTGAVGLGLCSLLPETEVVCVELSEEAFPYLEANLSAYPQYKTAARWGDVLSPETAQKYPPERFDFLAANPPYIMTAQLPALQPEVRREPSLALDGGGDGLRFYRAICGHWVSLLKPGGVLGVEIGEEQGAAVSALFRAAGLREIRVLRDLSGLDRCVLGNR